MPEYPVRLPNGRVIKITGPSPPSEDVLRVILERASAPPEGPLRASFPVPGQRGLMPQAPPMTPGLAAVQLPNPEPSMSLSEQFAFDPLGTVMEFGRGALFGAGDEATATRAGKYGEVLSAGAPLVGGVAGLMKAGRGLWSRVDDVVRRLPMKGSLHPNKIAAQLRSGASAEELAYRGIPEFLAGKGQTPVTRAELEAHLAAHPAPFPATKTLGDAPEDLVQAQDRLGQQIEIYQRAAFDDPADWVGVSRLDQVNARHWAYEAAAGDAEALRKLQQVAVDPDHLQTILHYGDLANQSRVLNERRLAEFPAPKYSQYTLPGGEQYRESLYTLPTRGMEPIPGQSAVRLQGREGRWTRWDMMPTEQAEAMRRDVPAGMDIEIKPAGRTPEPFTSGHFPEPNILAHARTTERTLPTGERGRFVEEVQSDWHQAGKKRGYDVPGEQYIAFYRTPSGQQVPLGHGATAADARAAVLPGWQDMPGVRIEVEARPTPAPHGAVPDAPFKETWPDLALKQQLLDAAQDPSTEWLGFTSGQTQAARYDLSKQISRVSYEPHDPGDYSLGTLVAYDKDGTEVLRQSRLEPHELDEYIGKEPGDKLRQQIASHEHEASQWDVVRDPDDHLYYVVDPNGDVVGEGFTTRTNADHELADMRMGANQWEEPAVPEIAGLDLQVGGEGMHKFYDELLPKRLEKIVKPFGGKVERVNIPTAGDIVHNNVPAFTVIDQTGSQRGQWMTRAEAEAYLRNPPAFIDPAQSRIQPITVSTTAPGTKTEPSWIVRLPPELKQRLLKEGLPLMMVPLAALGAAGQAAPTEK